LPVFGSANVPAATGAFFIVQGEIIESEPVLVHGFGDVVAWMAAVAGHRARVPAVFASPAPGFFGAGARIGAWASRLSAPGLVDTLDDRLAAWTEGPARALRAAIAGQLADVTDVCLTPSERDRDALLEGGAAEGAVELVAPRGGVDLDRFDPEAEGVPGRDEARRRLRIPERWRLVAGYAGELRPDRGGAALVRSIEEVARRHPGVGWVLLPDRGEGLASVVESELAAQIRRGRLVVADPDTPRRLVHRATDLYVDPGEGEDVPRAVLEAAAMETAVAAHRGGAMEMVVRDGQTGRLVDRDAGEDLADVVESMVSAPGRLEDYGIRGRVRCRERFDRRDAEVAVLELYDRVLESKLAEDGA
ncbi:MAG: glycosyltransferase, partial [Bradymonadaceae bacterium]